jgi:hypothetical protein
MVKFSQKGGCRRNASSFAIDGKAYVIGGFSISSYNYPVIARRDVWQFDSTK